MLPAAMRLGATSNISTTLRAGRRYANKYFVLHVLQTQENQAKFAFAVSKKVGNSVVRHRITRQLRHVVQDNSSMVPSGVHVVIRALPTVRDATFMELSAAFAQTLAKIQS